jgi:thiamine-monophosphate kinase
VRAAAAAGVATTPIGTILAGAQPPKFLDGQGAEIVLRRVSYSHF